MLLQLDARNPKELAVAEEIRRDILEFLPLVLEAPHFPPLTADEKQTIHLKLAFLRTQDQGSHAYKLSYAYTQEHTMH